MDLGHGETDVGDISKPANSAVFKAKPNLSSVFKITPFLPQVSRKSAVWKKASVIDSSQRIASSIILFFFGFFHILSNLHDAFGVGVPHTPYMRRFSCA